jgi:hypothetical protein
MRNSPRQFFACKLIDAKGIANGIVEGSISACREEIFCCLLIFSPIKAPVYFFLNASLLSLNSKETAPTGERKRYG